MYKKSPARWSGGCLWQKWAVGMFGVWSAGLDHRFGCAHVRLGGHVEPLLAEGVLDPFDLGLISEQGWTIDAFLRPDVLLGVGRADCLDASNDVLGLATEDDGALADAPAEVACREPDGFLTGGECRTNAFGIGLEAKERRRELGLEWRNSRVGIFAQLGDLSGQFVFDLGDLTIEFAIASEAGSGLVARLENSDDGGLFRRHGELSCE